MKTTDDKLTFEQAMKNLESCTSKLSAEDVNLEDAIKAYEEGVKYYDICRKILDEAQQRIEVLGTKETSDA